MASALRCSHIINGRLTTIQRQALQINNICPRVLSVVPIYNHNKQRNYHKNYQWNWQRINDYTAETPSIALKLISIGGASILIWNR